MKNHIKEMATIIVLPETDKNTLCVEFTGLIRLEDYRHNFREPIEEIVKNHGFYNLLINHAPAFRGWDEDAADLSIQTIIELAKYGRRRAMINPPEKFILMQKMSGEVFGGETRYFSQGQFQKALHWVKDREHKDGDEERTVDIEKVEHISTMAAGLLKVLANEKRLTILCKLYEGEKSVNELMEFVGLGQSALSQHLAYLRTKGIVRTRRDKQAVYYSLTNQQIQDLMGVLCRIYKS